MEKIIKEIIKFSKERNWEQFHTGANLAKSISIESGELLELFQWKDEPTDIEKLKDELADVIIYSIMLSNKYDFNIKEIVENKIKKNTEKYPISKSYGKSKKYTEL